MNIPRSLGSKSTDFQFPLQYPFYICLCRSCYTEVSNTFLILLVMEKLKNTMGVGVSRTGRNMQRYNLHGHRQVVGCIPYRYRRVRGEEEIEVVVITSQTKGKGMLFPKGGWEQDESIEDAALRETVEEAGVSGDVERKLGQWSFKKKDGTGYECHMFPLLVNEELDSWPEKDVRKRMWVSIKEARLVCQYWWMKEALELFVDRLSSPREENESKTVAIAGSATLVAKQMFEI